MPLPVLITIAVLLLIVGMALWLDQSLFVSTETPSGLERLMGQPILVIYSFLGNRFQAVFCGICLWMLFLLTVVLVGWHFLKGPLERQFYRSKIAEANRIGKIRSEETKKVEAPKQHF